MARRRRSASQGVCLAACLHNGVTAGVYLPLGAVTAQRQIGGRLSSVGRVSGWDLSQLAGKLTKCFGEFRERGFCEILRENFVKEFQNFIISCVEFLGGDAKRAVAAGTGVGCAGCEACFSFGACEHKLGDKSPFVQ